ncbi:glycosyltransferase family 2 protein [Fluviibacterium sp. DFM31]|uniref:Glycosyltransferase family 2 protein n=1 Tax=Meridianimarinicoccus marinus TaxID=3231483 RepID=A0ABV3L6R1_9RHOB
MSATSTRPKTPALSVVSPCYNEEAVLPELYRRVTSVCRETVGEDYEIVLVDDGSSDRTRAMMEELSAADPHVVAVILSRNHGHQLALTAGLQIARGDRILILDADLQDPPELLPKMMARMDDGVDVVYGKRTERRGETAFKVHSARLFYRVLNKLVEIDIPTDTGDFRLMSRRTLDTLNQMPEHHRFIRGMVSWIGFRQEPLEYIRSERLAGETKYPFRKMVHFAVDAIAGFSVLPLKISLWLGIICAVIGVMFMGYTVWGYLSGNVVQGWTTTMTAVLILGSGQLMMLGVIGGYLGRLYMQSKNRPLYIIDQIICQPKGNAAREDADRDDPAA